MSTGIYATKFVYPSHWRPDEKCQERIRLIELLKYSHAVKSNKKAQARDSRVCMKTCFRQPTVVW